MINESLFAIYSFKILERRISVRILDHTLAYCGLLVDFASKKIQNF